LKRISKSRGESDEEKQFDSGGGPMGATELMTKNIVDTTYDKLPSNVIEPTKKQILDTVGVAIAGGHSSHIRPVLDLVREWGGKEESSLLGYGGKVPCFNAALVNGFAAVVLDFDDFHDMDCIHVSRSIVPASLAVAERKRAVTGKEFMAAVALGFDLAARLARTPVFRHRPGTPWNSSPVCGFFGAAASAGKILELSQEQLTNAFGIALAQATGISAGTGTEASVSSTSKGLGRTIKGLDGGLSAKGGILAALFAEKGLTGVSNPIESERGFLSAFYGSAYRPAFLTLDLGKVFEGAMNGHKPYPCCRWNDTSIDATLALVREYDIKPEDVTEVIVQLGPNSFGLSQPPELRQNPVNTIISQFSLPWALANAIVYREVGIDHFTVEALQDRKVLEVASKVFGRLSVDLISRSATEPAIVEIRTNKNKMYSKRVDFPYGSAENPMSFDDIAAKFTYCCKYSANPIPQRNQENVIQMVKYLEEVTDVAEIARLLA
jgi:2-methylcitrate dehydratase PrpD